MENRNPLLSTELSSQSVWRILSVEDDLGYQDALVNALKSLDYGHREVIILRANSAQEAASVLSQHPDIGIILLDVVMETDDAGLRLVQSIREGLGNHLVRIVLLTGQPGMAPLEDVMGSYDIDDYWNKSDLSHEHLHTIVLSNLRTWEHLSVIQQARQGLQMLVESSQRLSNKLQLEQYTQAILFEIENLFHSDHGSIVCLKHTNKQILNDAQIFAATGKFAPLVAQNLEAIPLNNQTFAAVEESVSHRKHVIGDSFSVLYFSSHEVDQRDYIVIAFLREQLRPYQIELLKAFCENVNVGFKNVALHGRLSQLAYFDASTGIHNKNWLIRQINQLTPAERNDCQLLMLFVGELAFSEVLFGVQFGRQLIKHLHDNLLKKFPETIDIALFERDILVLLIKQPHNFAIETIRSTLHMQLTINEQLHSVGLKGCLIPLSATPDMSGIQLLGTAKSLLERVKHENSELGIFSSDTLSQIQERYLLLNDLREAIANNEIFIHLQPKVHLEDGALAGFEVLARWQHKTGTMIPPDEFIQMAETSGLIDRLDQNISKLTCATHKSLIRKGITAPLAVNAAGSELSRPDFVDRFIGLLQQEQVSPTAIEVEVTETQLIEERKSIIDHLGKLKALGVKVSIDDFGAGYSSLAYLSSFDTQVLKIDKQFIDKMLLSDRDTAIVATMIKLAHDFDMKVVAEGIENREQFEQLRAMGCDIGQGYYIAKPMIEEDAIAWYQAKYSH